MWDLVTNGLTNGPASARDSPYILAVLLVAISVYVCTQLAPPRRRLLVAVVIGADKTDDS